MKKSIVFAAVVVVTIIILAFVQGKIIKFSLYEADLPKIKWKTLENPIFLHDISGKKVSLSEEAKELVTKYKINLTEEHEICLALGDTVKIIEYYDLHKGFFLLERERELYGLSHYIYR